MQSPLNELHEIGQSVWYDNIHRRMLLDGELEDMILHDNLTGITSNPSIYEQAINGCTDYDAALSELVYLNPNASAEELFYSLAVEDIVTAADSLRTVYDRTNGIDGYVSIEVTPMLAYASQASFNQAKELFARINRPNVMIKIPATNAGIPVIESLIAEGINVNATLIFSLERYHMVANAYIQGLEKARAEGKDISRIASVASFFISRLDNTMDKLLVEHPKYELRALTGKVAIINAKRAYALYKNLFGGSFNSLRVEGARPQRLLWASTGTKSPAYSKTLYVDSLIGADTVNTMPPATLQAFKQQGTIANSLEEDIEKAEGQFQLLIDEGVDMTEIMNMLESDGVLAFEKSFLRLLASIESKTTELKQIKELVT